MKLISLVAPVLRPRRRDPGNAGPARRLRGTVCRSAKPINPSPSASPPSNRLCRYTHHCFASEIQSRAAQTTLATHTEQYYVAAALVLLVVLTQACSSLP